MKFGIIVFPGSNCDKDCYHVLARVLLCKTEFLWHKDLDLKGSDCVILPGGFSYGDYLRSGAMAATSPIMRSVRKFAEKGGVVLGICNGFQILQEAGLLPGVMMRNKTLSFICRDAYLRVERTDLSFVRNCKAGQVLRMPIAHMDGNFFIDKKGLTGLEKSRQVVLRYCDAYGEVTDTYNPNGSVDAIAAITNEEGNVCGMMPHPERSSESVFGSRDGLKIFESIIDSVTGNK